jgi:GNAT superfamily N-acetyltransferase
MPSHRPHLAPSLPDAIVAPAVTIQTLAPHHLPELVALQEEVVASATAGFLDPRSEQVLGEFLGGAQGDCIGVWEGDRLQAAGLLRLPHPDRPNEGPAFPTLTADAWRLEAAFLFGCMVRPQARGRGLQRRLVEARLALARSKGMRWACSGIAFDNTTSWRNLMACGMHVVGTRSAGGHLRVGFVRSLSSSAAEFAAGPFVLTAGFGDQQAHVDALDAGLVGVHWGADGVAYQHRSCRNDTPA